MHTSGPETGGPVPFTSHYYTSRDGLTLHYREYPGPPAAALTVLCIPGLTRNARDFEVLAPHLAQRYRVICAELRGRGLSAYAPDPATYVPATYVRDIAALLDNARLKHVAVIGTSLGGIIAMIMAGVMPSRLLGVIINDIGPELDAAGLTRIGSYVGKGKPITTWDEAAAVIEAMDRVIYPDYAAGDWHRMARRRFVERPEGGLRPDYDLNISKPFASSAANINLWPFFCGLRRIPALAIRGETSDLLSPGVFSRMKEEVPNLRQVTVPMRGHAPGLDEPIAISAIDQFLANLPPRLGPVRAAQRSFHAALLLVRLKLAGVL